MLTSPLFPDIKNNPADNISQGSRVADLKATTADLKAGLNEK